MDDRAEIDRLKRELAATQKELAETIAQGEGWMKEAEQLRAENERFKRGLAVREDERYKAILVNIKRLLPDFGTDDMTKYPRSQT